MTIMPSEFRNRQSSDDWQESVRFENRLRKIEKDIENNNRLMWWIVVGYISSIILLAAILLIHH